ncbi:MAG: Spy/CpxP family protein refolding chaperone [Proteobacteria bacterium]|nr:Spy/CpxP family protein refolding chaperone [Pseudomonadota bacterium]
MKRWIKRTLIGVFGASVLFGGLAACSHRAYHGAGWQAMSEEDAARMKARIVEKVAGKLDLDEAQKARLGVLADALREQRKALVAGGNPREQVQALVAGPTFDRAGAKSLLDAKTAALQGGSPAVIAAFGDFYDGLRPEQQAKLREFMSRGRHGWRG